ncbi:unnamed protein product, partial [Oppiella nova]
MINNMNDENTANHTLTVISFTISEQQSEDIFFSSCSTASMFPPKTALCRDRSNIGVEVMVGIDCKRFVDLKSNHVLMNAIKCGICLKVIINSVDTPCDHSYCSECLEDWVVRRGRKWCPQTSCKSLLCSEDITLTLTTDDDKNLIHIGHNVMVKKNVVMNSLVSQLKMKCDFLKLPTLLLNCNLSYRSVNSLTFVSKTLFTPERNPYSRLLTCELENEIKKSQLKLNAMFEYKRTTSECISSDIPMDCCHTSHNFMSTSIASLLCGDCDDQVFGVQFIRFGTYETKSTVMMCRCDHIVMRQVVRHETDPNTLSVKIPFKETEQLFYCTDPSDPTIFLRLTPQSSSIIQNAFNLGVGSPGGTFHVTAQEPKKQFITIRLTHHLSPYLMHNNKSITFALLSLTYQPTYLGLVFTRVDD